MSPMSMANKISQRRQIENLEKRVVDLEKAVRFLSNVVLVKHGNRIGEINISLESMSKALQDECRPRRWWQIFHRHRLDRARAKTFLEAAVQRANEAEACEAIGIGLQAFGRVSGLAAKWADEEERVAALLPEAASE